MTLYHLAEPEAWAAAGESYSAASLADEGFIHCATEEQLAGVVQRYYAGRSDLILLTLDADRLERLVFEDLLGRGERFPHVYAPIRRSAIVHAERFIPNPGKPNG